MHSQGASRKSHDGDTLNHIGGVGQPRISLAEPVSASRISRLCSLMEFCRQKQFYENCPKEGLGDFRGDNYFKIPKKEIRGLNGSLDIFDYQAILDSIRPESKDPHQANKHSSICIQREEREVRFLYSTLQ